MGYSITENVKKNAFAPLRCEMNNFWSSESSRSVDFFRRMGGMRLPNRRASNNWSSCNSSNMLWNASWAFYAKSTCLKKVYQTLCIMYTANTLNHKGLRGLSVVLDGVQNRSWQRYHSHSVKFVKIETFSLNFICNWRKKKRSICSMLCGQNTINYRFLNLMNFLYEKSGGDDNIGHPPV